MDAPRIRRSSLSGRRLVLVLPLAFFWAGGARSLGLLADDADWKVGLARIDITPQEPVRLAGYASRTQPHQGVLAPIHAKALAIEDASGARAVLITADLIGFPARVAEPIAERITAGTGLPRRNILIAASHTHTGPALARDTEDVEPATAAYTRWLADRVVDVAARSLAELRPARFAYGAGVAPFVMNRREFTRSGVRLGVNPRGLADRTVPVLRVEAVDGELLAVLFGCACHNTTLTGEHFQISGDYAGFAQLAIEARHPAAQAMFLCGFAGDANPYPRGTVELARAHGETLGAEVLRVLETELRPVRGPLRTAFGRAALPLEAPPPPERLRELADSGGGLEKWTATRMLAVLDRGEELPRTYTAPFAVWQLGADLTLVALPGEVVVDFVPLLEEALGRDGLWLAAYANDVFGYLPSRKVIREGGYETRGLYAGGLGRFAPEVEEVVVRTAVELATRAREEAATTSAR